MKAKGTPILTLIVLIPFISGCLTTNVNPTPTDSLLPATTQASPQPSPTISQPTKATSPTSEAPTKQASTETAGPTPQPPMEPPPSQVINFTAADDTQLVGTYFLGLVDTAPTIILMHQFGSNRITWERNGLAFWLQDPQTHQSNIWPQMPDDISFAVFTFDFRGHGDSAGNTQGERSDFLMDAKAAFETVKELPGVDPDRIVLLGASIGADAAIDVCVQGCLGAFSLSPGGYLDVPYVEVIEELGADNKPAWCLAAEDDPFSAETCNSASGESYFSIIYPHGGHGEALIKPGMDPDIGQAVADFLSLAFGMVH